MGTSASKAPGGARSTEDAALGCLLGLACGDAAGAPLEFIGRRPTPEEAKACLRMPGGGPIRVGPGQVTDDTELALALAHGLLDAASARLSQPPGGGEDDDAWRRLPFPSVAVARRYAEWLASWPFDVGITCRKAFAELEGLPEWAALRGPEDMRRAQDGLEQRLARVARQAASSQANGALMRAAPLAVWGHRLPVETLAACARADARLSHPSPVCQVANAVYVVALAHLVRRPGDAAGALATADGWLKGGSHDGALKEGLGPVRQWWLDDSRDWARAAQELDCGVDDSTIGWLRWALTLSAAFLRRCCDDDAGQQPQVTYEEVVCAVLERGGDTDTNAAIVGAVVGALLGARAGVPEFAKGPVLAFDPTVAGGAREGGEAGGPCKGHQRPAMYGCGQLPQLAARLLRAAPGGA